MWALGEGCMKPVARLSSVDAELMGEIKLAQQEWILGDTGTKFVLLAKKGRFWGVLCVQGEFCPAWALTEASWASFVPPVG